MRTREVVLKTEVNWMEDEEEENGNRCGICMTPMVWSVIAIKAEEDSVGDALINFLNYNIHHDRQGRTEKTRKSLLLWFSEFITPPTTVHPLR